MDRLAHKLHNRSQRKGRIRAQVTGTTERPRLSVYISNLHVTAQLIDDSKHATLVYVSSVGKNASGGTMTEKAAWVGNEVAKKAVAAKQKQVVFDRGGKRYHGRIKALADAARNAGLEF